MTNSTGCCYSL